MRFVPGVPLILLIAMVAFPFVGPRPLLAEVVVIAGSAAGRTEKAPGAGHVNEPFAVAYDAAGTLYGVEYTRGNRLFRVGRPGEPDAPSRVEFVAGVFWQPDPKVPLPPQATTDPSEVRFHGPHDLALGANGSVYVADTFANRIWSFDPKQNTVRVVAGTGKKGFAGDGGPAVDAEFNQAYCSSLTPDGGANVGADLLSTQLMRPHGVCLDPQGRLVIADSDNDRIITGEIAAVKSR